ncbi:putative non-specific lipid-transfer protein 14 [Impatiens glandulifera]|uniref:putative non-specific lipid-transfer protein 14 n=1 Tax=Impatiens glandulifera TaxID=253017 RepID=UPI001FB11717|nr:putative non-specific lipid-transfer protein 14 [Impatiens glandulifera]
MMKQQMRKLVVLVIMIGVGCIASARGSVDCNTVTAFISACSTFVSYGSPDPIPGTPCCQAVGSINTLATSRHDRQSICRCLMGLITVYNPNATAIATLPGFCGVSLGFIIAPNTDCN